MTERPPGCRPHLWENVGDRVEGGDKTGMPTGTQRGAPAHRGPAGHRPPHGHARPDSRSRAGRRASRVQGSPLLTQGFPLLAQGSTPQLAQGSQLLVQGSPLLARGSPLLAQGSPLLTQGFPLLARGTPLLVQGSPLMSLGSPLLAQGTPLMSLVPGSSPAPDLRDSDAVWRVTRHRAVAIVCRSWPAVNPTRPAPLLVAHPCQTHTPARNILLQALSSVKRRGHSTICRALVTEASPGGRPSPRQRLGDLASTLSSPARLCLWPSVRAGTADSGAQSETSDMAGTGGQSCPWSVAWFEASRSCSTRLRSHAVRTGPRLCPRHLGPVYRY
ncbi:hypothetical protein TREES_T100021423 [Tupaia chinensis]|uniref:Uncharacterized protein n=1 Tax=Tupaia chinensis TaxID=246437 RepID=L9L200_TUPCH|nr:hypothetical protein TREES_T100021423 [Tupaia chinensis]